MKEAEYAYRKVNKGGGGETVQGDVETGRYSPINKSSKPVVVFVFFTPFYNKEVEDL